MSLLTSRTPSFFLSSWTRVGPLRLQVVCPRPQIRRLSGFRAASRLSQDDNNGKIEENSSNKEEHNRALQIHEVRDIVSPSPVSTLKGIVLNLLNLRKSQVHRAKKNTELRKPSSKGAIRALPINVGSRHGPERRKSLLEELFPEQVKDRQKPMEDTQKADSQVPRFEPPTFDDFRNEFFPTRENVRGTTLKTARNENTTILVLDGGNLNLCEADFRRVAPKGWHIEEWRGREDPLKIIPARNEKSLLFKNRYYLVFPNAGLASAYKQRAEFLHKLARAHTPTSLMSPLLPPTGTMVNGEDAGALVREYTLAPPSQPLSLRVLHPPYQHSVLRLLAADGTVPLVHPTNQAGRSVLLWVDGHQPSTYEVGSMIGADGRDRGFRWSPSIGNGTIEQFDGQPRLVMPKLKDEGDSPAAEEEVVEEQGNKGIYRRWLITFEDETEARRFIRVWHRRAFPLWQFGVPWEDGEPLPLVHAEFIW